MAYFVRKQIRRTECTNHEQVTTIYLRITRRTDESVRAQVPHAQKSWIEEWRQIQSPIKNIQNQLANKNVLKGARGKKEKRKIPEVDVTLRDNKAQRDVLKIRNH